MTDKRYLVLGGGGLVGLQVARRIAYDLKPDTIIIASLYEQEVQDALDSLREMYAGRGVVFIGVHGNIFVRSELTHVGRRDLLTGERREALYDDLLGPIGDAYERSRLVDIIREYRPNVIVDCINTATAISYQDIYTASRQAKQHVDSLLTDVRASANGASADGTAALADRAERAETAFETMLISMAVPQLIRHVTLLNQAMREVGTRLYLKIGTTGTGGMGLNIPYTHGEDKPSAQLMSKTAVAFAHTGLLFLMARTVGGPIVKEIKPGAMIGYADVASRIIREKGFTMQRFTSRAEELGHELVIRTRLDEFGNLGPLELPVVDTGENGMFTKGEFEAITSLRQMEYITPEEIAREVMLEIIGSNTGQDVIAAINSSVMNPTYRAGYLRQQALDELTHLEQETGTHSVALGQLGPPQLSKLLWEGELLNLVYGTLHGVLAESAESIAHTLYDFVTHNDNVRQTITSIGVPILAPDGRTLIRGPFIRIPEHPGLDPLTVPVAPGDIDTWANKGWVDLRPTNCARWRARFEAMSAMRRQIRLKGSAAITRQGYTSDDIRIGTIVGWIFSNEEDGYRIK